MRLAVLLALLVASACATAPSDQKIEQLDVTVTVAADGSALVQERFVVHLGTTPVGEFRWRSPAWQHDGVSDVVASMDGASFRAGEGAGRVMVADGPGLDVRWMFAPASAAHVFGLSYRAANVVHLSGIRGTVSWRAVPSGARPQVAAARITVTAPDSVVLLQDPWVDEAGWTVTRLAHGMTATRGPVPAGEPATAGIEFTIDHMTAPRPQWQTDSERAAQFIPAWVSAALFILVVAAGVLWIMRMRYPVWTAAADGTPPNIGTARVLWRAKRRSGQKLVVDVISDGLVDHERVIAARDLWRAGIAVIVLGILSWVVTRWTLWHYGAWPLVVPFSIVTSGLVFLVGAARFPVLTEAGVKARVLYCARILDGRTTE